MERPQSASHNISGGEGPTDQMITAPSRRAHSAGRERERDRASTDTSHRYRVSSAPRRVSCTPPSSLKNDKPYDEDNDSDDASESVRSTATTAIRSGRSIAPVDVLGVRDSPTSVSTIDLVGSPPSPPFPTPKSLSGVDEMPMDEAADVLSLERKVRTLELELDLAKSPHPAVGSNLELEARTEELDLSRQETMEAKLEIERLRNVVQRLEMQRIVSSAATRSPPNTPPGATSMPPFSSPPRASPLTVSDVDSTNVEVAFAGERKRSRPPTASTSIYVTDDALTDNGSDDTAGANCRHSIQSARHASLKKIGAILDSMLYIQKDNPDSPNQPTNNELNSSAVGPIPDSSNLSTEEKQVLNQVLVYVGMVKNQGENRCVEQKEQVRQAKQMVRDLKTELDKTRSKLESNTFMILNLKAERNDLKAALTKKKQENKGIDASSLEAQLEMMDFQLQEAKAQLDAVQGERDDLRAKSVEKNPNKSTEYDDKNVTVEVKADIMKEMEEMQVEHDRAIRAIQRVLADVTTTRDERISELCKKIEDLETDNCRLADKLKNAETSNPQSDGHDRVDSDSEERHCPEEAQNVSKETANTTKKAGDNKQYERDANVALEKEIAKMRVEIDELHSAQNELLIRIKVKDEAIAELERDRNELKEATDEWDTKLEEVANEIQAKDDQLMELEQEREELSLSLSSETAKANDLRDELQQVKENESKLRLEREAEQTISEAESQASSAKSEEENSKLRGELEVLRKENVETRDALLETQKDLNDKSSSLENAKKIIASLEQSSGSVTSGLRAQLKEKEDETEEFQKRWHSDQSVIEKLTLDNSDQKRKIEKMEKESKESNEKLRKHRSMHRQLRHAVNDIRSKGGHSGGGTVVDQISKVVRNSLHFLDGDSGADGTINSDMSASVRSAGSVTTSGSDSSEVDDLRKQLEAVRAAKEWSSTELRSKLNRRDTKIKILEDALKGQKEDMDRLREEMEQIRNEGEEDLVACQTEIQRLKDELTAQARQMDKKENELSVMKESFGDMSGYISDPDDDEEEEVADGKGIGALSLAAGTDGMELMLSQAAPRLAPRPVSPSCTSVTTAAQSPERVKSMEDELSTLRREKELAIREGKKQEESLANAKLIISSLENANRSMIEDLRSRLHDSNTAIVSLLEKSNKHEETTAALRSEMKSMERAKDDQISSYQSEVGRYKEDALVSACRLAAQEREITELRRLVSGTPNNGMLSGGKNQMTLSHESPMERRRGSMNSGEGHCSEESSLA